MGNVRVSATLHAATATTVGLSVATWVDGPRDGEGRNVYGWSIAVMEQGETRFLASGDLDPAERIRSGVGDGVDALAALDTLLSFMAMDAEVYAGGMRRRSMDGRHFSFGAEMAELLYLNDDAVSELTCDVEETRDDIA